MNKEEVKVRLVRETEVEELQEISIHTFYSSFAGQNTEADMKKYIESSFNLEKLKKELSSAESRFYFAEIDDEVIAYIKLNYGSSQTEEILENALEIERIYVLSTFQGKKIGQLLYNKAIEFAKSFNKKTVWLGVWENNTRAIRFYKNNGFEEFDTHVFMLGNDEQTDILMKYELS